MTITTDHTAATAAPLASTDNGVVTPLWFPRQLVLAEDLTLERGSRDAELERARRLLHGWGVVAGLVPTVDGDRLTVSRGYAVTSSGEEVYLAAELSADDLRAAVLACCGDDPDRCALEDHDDHDDDDDEGDEGVEDEPRPHIAWLVARPTSHAAAPRATVPEGCQHPANTLRPSRRCHGVRLELTCDLPASHAGMSDPALLHAIACGTLGLEGEAPLLPMPELPEDDGVVLGQLAVLDGEVSVRVFGRRVLLPTQVLQEWLVRRTCLTRYYVNTRRQRSGDHEVHVEDCFLRTRTSNRHDLGEHTSPDDALAAARAAGFTAVDGCRFCLPTVHRR